LDPNPEKEIINVQLGSAVPVSFITLEASEEPPLQKNLNGARILWSPYLKQNPEILNYAARVYDPINHECFGDFCEPNRGLFSLMIRYVKWIKRSVEVMDLYPRKKTGFWNKLKRSLFSVKNFRAFKTMGFVAVKEIDEYLGILDLSDATVERLPTGHWKITIDVQIPQTISHIDPEYFLSHILLLSPGWGGLHKLLGVSQQSFQHSHVLPLYRITTPADQLQRYGFEVRQTDSMLKFKFQFPPGQFSSPAIRDQPGIQAINDGTEFSTAVLISSNTLKGHVYISERHQPNHGMNFLTISCNIGGRKFSAKTLSLRNFGRILPSDLYRRRVEVEADLDARTGVLSVNFPIGPSVYSPSDLVRLHPEQLHDAIVEEKCSVCLESLNVADGNVVKMPRCTHAGHTHCMHQALSVDDRCPLCRAIQQYSGEIKLHGE
jgi:hypothetical protein